MDPRPGSAAIIPAFNEALSLPRLIRLTARRVQTVLVVDDGSTDGTAKAAEEAGAAVIINEKNLGKGYSLVRGVLWCREKGLSPAVLLDADGQHPPESIEKFFEAYDSGDCDLVLGTRMSSRGSMPLVRYLTNRFMSLVSSRLMGARVTDSQCGFRLYGKRIIDLHAALSFRCARFDYESEILLYASALGMRIREVPVPCVYLEGRKSRIRPLSDALRWFKSLFEIRKSLKSIKLKGAVK